MGNRATITTAPFRRTNPAIYIHWNGGRDSIEGFLKAAKELGYRSPGCDGVYAMARLTGMLCAFFGMDDDTGVGVGTVSELISAGDDNGCYVIGGDWEIVERRDCSGRKLDLNDDEREGYDIDEFAADLVAKVKAATVAVQSVEK